MISMLELICSRYFLVATLLSLLFLGYVRWLWKRYFKESTEAKLDVGNLLAAISIGITAVSILLPSTGAILIYYLKSLSPPKLPTTYPLFVAVLFFGVSLLVGVWNAFALPTETPGGKEARWTSPSIAHILFFVTQFVLFLSAIILVVWFFLHGLSVQDLMEKPKP